MNIAYAFDNGYAQHAGVSLLSLLEHNRDIENLQLYLPDNWLDTTHKKRFEEIATCYHRQLTWVHLDMSTLGTVTFYPSSYARLFLAEHLDVDRAVYVDSDTVICESLRDLDEIEMSHTLVAGVQDTVNPYYLKRIHLPASHRYICCGGLIVLNLKLWREQHLMQKAIEVIRRYHGNPPHHDQGVLNVICQGAIRILPLKYNVMPPIFQFTAAQLTDLFRLTGYYSQEELEEARRHPVVIHYTDEFFRRPWQTACTHPYQHLYQEQLQASPWAGVPLEQKRSTLNCRIQNGMVRYAPFFLYRWMIRYIEFTHEKDYLLSPAE